MGVAINARKRIYGLADDTCESQEAGYLLGRLFLARRITKAQLDAGNRMAEDYSRYYGLTGIPMPSARAQDLFAVKGEPGPGNPPAARHAANVVMGIEGALGRADESGRPVTSVTKRVCVQEDDAAVFHTHMITFLRRGLDALVVHYSGGT